MLSKSLTALAALALAMSRTTNAACECGYSLDAPGSDSFELFTDLMETDFLHATTDNFTATGWQPYNYTVKSEEARGSYGKRMNTNNVVLNPLKDLEAWSGESVHGGDAGMQMWVRGDHPNDIVDGVDMSTQRKDMQYGTFRASMKLANRNGTCGGYFWYYNNSQEIDLEFLSREFVGNGGAVNLVLQTPESALAGDASGTEEFKTQDLDFRPDEQFHEYRFDWTPKRVTFFVDGGVIWEIETGVPQNPGSVFFNHWSNGNPYWSAGPPDQDTVMTVAYQKSYFNSTDPARQKAHTDRCPTFDPTKVCTVPDVKKAPDGKDAQTYFFTQDGGDKTPGQILYRSSASSFFGSSNSILTYLPLIAALFWTISL